MPCGLFGILDVLAAALALPDAMPPADEPWIAVITIPVVPLAAAASPEGLPFRATPRPVALIVIASEVPGHQPFGSTQTCGFGAYAKRLVLPRSPIGSLLMYRADAGS